jgi:hypothetical protein
VPYRRTVVRIILILLGIWIALIVVGWIVKGLFWLAIAGGLFFLATTALGASRRR